MSKAYVLRDGGLSRPMERVRCKDEDKELQLILALNPDLLPGDQINPENPRRWLLIEREMPVPDPASGADRWSIDLLFVDQSGIPTFVECKRFGDTRARREVIGQMIEYAANGQYYWEEAELAERASKNAEAAGSDLSEVLRTLAPDDDLSVGDFFERVQLNLREGQLRLVFFLEEAPPELKSLVDFLNKQMERSEVLLVEAQQFCDDSLTIVYPRLFGYTEEARRVKKTRTVSVGPKRAWDDASFRRAIAMDLDETSSEQVSEMYEFLSSIAPERRWGSANAGGIGFCWPGLCSSAIFSLYGDGSISVNLGEMRGNDRVESIRDQLFEKLTKEFGWEIKEDYRKRYPRVKLQTWGKHAKNLKALVQNVMPVTSRDLI